MEKYSNLRKRTAHVEDRWTLENIKDGFLYFYELNNHYPTVHEIDGFEFLPTSRTLQRAFGGAIAVRKELGLDGPHNHTEGAVRAIMARNADGRARKYEKEFYSFLITKIPEIRVHEHKIIRPGDTASDFFIYTGEKDGVVIDLFYAQDLFSLGGIVNIKMTKYLKVNYPVYFVLTGNNKITQEQINQKINNRKIPLPTHIQVVTEIYFKEQIMGKLDFLPIQC